MKNNLNRIGYKHLSGNLFIFRFGSTSLQCHCTFLKVTIKKIHSILIICHFGHFSFSTLFLDFAQYMLSSISAPSDFTPINVVFFQFLFCFYFLKLFFEKTVSIAKFSGSQILVKKRRKISLTNLPFWYILKSPQKTTYVFNRISRAFLLVWDVPKVGITIWCRRHVSHVSVCQKVADSQELEGQNQNGLDLWYPGTVSRVT